MSNTKNFTEQKKKTEIIDDMTNENNDKPIVAGVDQEKLAALKARMEAKKQQEQIQQIQNQQTEEEMAVRIVEQKTHSIRFGFFGSGQCGSRLAESAYKLGYPAVVINTAPQDLSHIEIPENNKLLLDFGLGGAAKDLSIGHSAAEAYADAIYSLAQQKLGNEELIIFCTSLGGGSGAGSVEIVIDILSRLDVPIVAMVVLPQTSDDTQTKSNALQTLSKLAVMVKARKIVNLIVVDNAKIESIYSDVNPFLFFKMSNKAIMEPIDFFNRFSAKTSAVKGLDSNEFCKLFIDGNGITAYGSLRVENYEEPESIAETIIENLNGNLLASGFDITQAKYVGFMLVAPKKVWEKITASSLSYANSLIEGMCNSPSGIFQGIYEIEDSAENEDCITIYTMFSGLGFPTARIEQLKTETKEKLIAISKKDQDRNLTLKLDVGEENVSKADEIRKKIELKKSAFGKLHGKAVEDRRKR